jgi:hypothetical protein
MAIVANFILVLGFELIKQFEMILIDVSQGFGWKGELHAKNEELYESLLR